MKDFTISDEQMKQAKKVRDFSENKFYHQHDKDDMEAIALTLGVDLDDLLKINKKTLLAAIFSMTNTVIDVGGAERSRRYYENELDAFFPKKLAEVDRIEATIKKAAADMVKNPYQSTDHWRIDSLIELHAELEVLYGLVRIFYSYEKETKTWTPRLSVDHDEAGNEIEFTVSLEDVRWELQREMLQSARRGSLNRSSSVTSNLEEDQKNAARAKILAELHNDLESAYRHGVERIERTDEGIWL